jgi:hypothetical protein
MATDSKSGVDRRAVLGGAVLSAGALAAGPGAQAEAPSKAARPAPYRIHKVVYDERFAEPVRFARTAESLGLKAHAISGDMTALWYHELDGLWREQAVAVAGMTAHGPMFCLELLARDRGMRLVYQAEHQIADAEVRHTVSGALPSLRRSTGLTRSGAAWPELMAALVADTPVGPALNGAVGVVTRTEAAKAAREPLFTWVIGPVSQT